MLPQTIGRKRNTRKIDRVERFKMLCRRVSRLQDARLRAQQDAERCWRAMRTDQRQLAEPGLHPDTQDLGKFFSNFC